MVYKFEPSIILEAIMLYIMYLILTSDHLFASWHRHRLGREEFHSYSITIKSVPMRTKQWVEKAITFELRIRTRNFHYPHIIITSHHMANYLLVSLM